MKQIFILLAAAAVFIISVGLLTQKLTKPVSKPTKTIKIAATKLNVEIADTETLRQNGLSNRTGLAPDRGMLFIFSKKSVVPPFWMKDMLIPLDIIWIKNSEVFQISKNIPAPKKGTPDSQLSLIVPKAPVDYVLEVNAGYSDKNGIVLGTPVDLSGI